MIDFEAITNYAGEGLVKVIHWEKTIQTMRVKEAERLRDELTDAIEAARNEELKLDIAIAAREAAAK